MGKYIWPHQLREASVWYLQILSGKRKLTIDALMAEQIRSHTHQYSRQQTWRHLDSLVERALIVKGGRYHNATYQITTNGTKRLEQLSLSKLQTNSPWDAKWRLIFFDIPEDTRSARDQIRRLLKELGFKQLQLSVWVHPLPCFEHFKKIQDAYGIANHLFMVQASEINIPKKIIDYFQRRYPKHHIE